MNILIVDNDSSYRGVLAEYLVMGGYSVFAAEDGSTAMKILKQESIDLVISDIYMPGISGPDLHKMMRGDSRFLNIPFIFISGYPDLRGSSVIKDPAKDHVMSKLSSARELSTVVEQHARKAPPRPRHTTLADAA